MIDGHLHLAYVRTVTFRVAMIDGRLHLAYVRVRVYAILSA